MRKFARLEAAPARVQALFADFEAWPRWMPGVKATRVVAAKDGHSTVEVTQQFMGRTFHQRLDCRVTSSTLVLRQVAGFFKRFVTIWRFSAPPDEKGDATTLGLELDLDLGVVGLFSPRAAIQGALDRRFAQTISRAREQLETKERRSRTMLLSDRSENAPGDILLQVFQTEEGLEVLVSGRRFVIPVGRTGADAGG